MPIRYLAGTSGEMKTAALVSLSLALGAAAVVGGYAFYQRSTCSGLEDDYLNSISKMDEAVRMQGLARLLGRTESIDVYETAIEAYSDTMLRTLTAVYDTCGDRAGKTAERKGRELLQQ